jgi:dihydropyrimidine dehydrogenase (NAD+) subunit PreA
LRRFWSAIASIGCEDTSHQAIAALRVDGERRYEVIESECVGCNLCYLACPVDGCITMVKQEGPGGVLTWGHHPNNPLRKEAAE